MIGLETRVNYNNGLIKSTSLIISNDQIWRFTNLETLLLALTMWTGSVLDCLSREPGSNPSSSTGLDLDNFRDLTLIALNLKMECSNFEFLPIHFDI